MPQNWVIVRTYANCVISVGRSAEEGGAWRVEVLDSHAQMHMPDIRAGNAEKAIEQATAFVDELPARCREWAQRVHARI